jgi:Trk K+ transport system NAD-binding subunit
MAVVPTSWRTAHGHVIVFGLRGLGVRIVEQLHLAGVDVVVVDNEADHRLEPVLEGWGVPRIMTAPNLAATLADAGLAGARALIAVAADELQGLEATLLANDTRKDLRVVLRMTNEAVGAAVAEVTGAGTVLDVSVLASPSVVEACLQRRSGELDLGGERFRIVEVQATRSATLRQLFGDLAPVAVVDGGGQTAICPGRDHPVAAGDQVVVVGTAAELAEVGTRSEDDRRLDVVERRRRGRARALRRLSRGVATLRDDTTRPFRYLFSALVILLVASTLLLHFGYRRPGGLSLLDSLYFTVETVVTVGFGDFTYSSQSTWLLLWGILLMIAGALLVTTLLALLTNFLVSRRLAEQLGQRDIHDMAGHVVVVGLGAIGLRVVEGLVARGAEVAIIERSDNNRNLARARSLGVPILIADATVNDTLERTNVARARAVAVMTSNDLTNIEVGLAMRAHLHERGRPIPVVLRVFDRELGRTVERDFGFRYVRSTSALAAPWFVGAALGLDILQTFYVEQDLLLVARLTVAPAGGLAGLAMQDIPAQVRVVAIARAATGRLEHPPRRDTRFAAGDQAYLIGPYRELLVTLRRDAEAVGTTNGAGPREELAAAGEPGDERGG